ncbi:MAG: hypothetical protein GX038_02185 [Erysipelothrix sp.]|nr:hypothetical protein [Erysipelothrix sp.]
MLKEEIFIEKPIEEVWEYIVLEYAKSFKCSPSQLKDKVLETKAKTFNNQEVSITQTVVALEEGVKIEVASENSKDYVVTGYELSADEDGTFLSTYEEGKGQNSTLRTLNYKLWTLPFLKKSSVRRLRQRLESIKGILEGTFEVETENTEEI